MISGQITLNGVGTKELVAIINAKDASPTAGLQIAGITPTTTTTGSSAFNVGIVWADLAGFTAVSNLLASLVTLGG